MANIYLALKRASLEIETLSASLKRKITVILEERNVVFILLFTGVSSREITSGDETSGSVLLPAPIQGDLLPANRPLEEQFDNCPGSVPCSTGPSKMCSKAAAKYPAHSCGHRRGEGQRQCTVT